MSRYIDADKLWNNRPQLSSLIKEYITSQEQRIKELTEENERLRAELEQRPPKLIITKLPEKEN